MTEENIPGINARTFAARDERRCQTGV